MAQPSSEIQVKKPAPAAKKSRTSGRLPMLLEMVYSSAGLIVTILGILVAGISLLSGATVIDAAIRAGCAIFLVGLVLAMVFWLVAGGSLEQRPRVDVKKSKQKGDPDAPVSTLEVKA